MLNTFPYFFLCILSTSLDNRYYYYIRFTDEASKGPCLKNSWLLKGQDLNPVPFLCTTHQE